jgi:hypothetical protein
MNILSKSKMMQVVASLVEGNSIRSTVRMTGVSKNAIQRLMAKLGPELPVVGQFENLISSARIVGVL